MITEHRQGKEEIRKFLKSLNKREYDMFIDYLVPSADYATYDSPHMAKYQKSPWEVLETAVDLVKTELKTEGWGVKKWLGVEGNFIEMEYKGEEPIEKKTRVWIGKSSWGSYYTFIDTEKGLVTGPYTSMDDAAKWFDHHHSEDRDSFDIWSFGGDILDFADGVYQEEGDNV